jgi:uncharacterized protein with HEPN domain
VKDALVHIDHILECIDWILRYTADGKDSFLADRKTQSAVMRELQTLAESTQRLPSELKQRHGDIPWRDIGGFRNVLVHGYLGIRVERVWEIVERDLQPLRAAVRAMLEEIQVSGGNP